MSCARDTPPRCRQKIVGLLEKQFEARMTDFTPVFTVGPLVRLHVVVWKDDGTVPEVPAERLEAEMWNSSCAPGRTNCTI